MAHRCLFVEVSAEELGSGPVVSGEGMGSGPSHACAAARSWAVAPLSPARG
jgi:hypothetical protein